MLDAGFWMLDAGSKILIVIVIMISLPLLLSSSQLLQMN